MLNETTADMVVHPTLDPVQYLLTIFEALLIIRSLFIVHAERLLIWFELLDPWWSGPDPNSVPNIAEFAVRTKKWFSMIEAPVCQNGSLHWYRWQIGPQWCRWQVWKRRKCNQHHIVTHIVFSVKLCLSKNWKVKWLWFLNANNCSWLNLNTLNKNNLKITFV